MTYPVITPPSSLGEAVSSVATLSDDDFNVLLEVTATPRSFSLSNTQVEILKEKIPLLANNISYVLSALSYLYSQIEGIRSQSDDMADIINHLLIELDVDDPDITEILQPRLQSLLRENDEYTNFRKVRRLRSGFLPNAVSFRSMLDLRPDFGDSDVLEYRGLVKVIQFRILTDSDDSTKREMVFQMDDESLEELAKTIDRLRRKIQAIDENEDLSLNYRESGL